MIKYIYPLTQIVILGEGGIYDLEIKPNVSILVERLLCNAPAAGMFTVKESTWFYEHDPWGDKDGVPSKRPKLVIAKGHLKRLTLEYNGYCPGGYVNGLKFMFNYSFIGNQVD